MYYKIMFMSTTMTGTLITISSYSWMGMWIGLEINLLSIIPLMSDTKNMMASEAALKYFISQSLASTLLLFSIIMMSLSLSYKLEIQTYFNLIINTALLTKMGAAPFHFWFPEVMEGLNWITASIMLTWQKIAPMILLTFFNQNTPYILMAIIFSMLISGIMGINQSSIRKIMTYSSINHVGWMLSTILVMETIWMYYFMIYTIMTINIILILKLLNIFYLKQLYTSMNYNYLLKIFFILNFLSLGGLPPLLGFLPKWLTIQTLVQNHMTSISVIMIVMTLMTLYFYIRITFSTLLLKTKEISFYSTPLISEMPILTINFVTLIGLIFSTTMFSFL